MFSLSFLFYFNLIRTNAKRDSMAKFDQGQLIVKKKSHLVVRIGSCMVTQFAVQQFHCFTSYCATVAA